MFCFFDKYANFNKYYLEKYVSSSELKKYKHLNSKENRNIFSGKVEFIIILKKFFTCSVQS